MSPGPPDIGTPLPPFIATISGVLPAFAFARGPASGTLSGVHSRSAPCSISSRSVATSAATAARKNGVPFA